jgi:hypothetical protein
MKKSKKIYWLIPLILILLAATYILSPIYNIGEIEVEGENEAAAEKIVEASGLMKGENILIALLERGNIFTMRFTGAELKLAEAFPGFEKISVAAKLPSEVKIKYEIREPAFEIEYGDIYLVTDINGCMLQSRREHETGLMRLKGVDVTGFTVGCVPGESDIFEKAAAIYNEMTWFDTENLTAFREYVEWVDFSMANTIALMYDGRVLVKMDMDGDVSYQTASMCVILSQKIGSGETGVLDFTAGDNPVFTTE